MSRSSIAGSKDHRRVQGAQGNATLSGPLPGAAMVSSWSEAKVCVIEWIQIGDMTREISRAQTPLYGSFWGLFFFEQIILGPSPLNNLPLVFSAHFLNLGQDYPCGRRSPRARYSATIKEWERPQGMILREPVMLGKVARIDWEARFQKAKWCQVMPRYAKLGTFCAKTWLGHGQLQKHFVLQEETWYWRSPVLRQSDLRDLGVDYGASPEQNNSIAWSHGQVKRQSFGAWLRLAQSCTLSCYRG